ARAETQAAEQAKRRRVWIGLAASLLVGFVASLALAAWAIRAERIAATERDAKQEALGAETAARNREKQAREQAMAALDTLTDDLVENQIARGPFLTEENKALLRKTIEQYERFAALTGDDAESRSIRAKGYLRVGLMHYRLGELTEAERSLNAAVEIMQMLAAEYPGRAGYHTDLATCLVHRGSFLREIGRSLDAESDYAAALNILTILLQQHPDQSHLMVHLAALYNRRGILLQRTNRFKEAQEELNAAIDLYECLIDESKTLSHFRVDLANSYNNRANLFTSFGQLSKAENDYQRALALYQAFTSEYPFHSECRANMANTHNNLAILYWRRNQLPEAEKEFGAAIEIEKRLVGDFPARPDFRMDLARTLSNRASVYLQKGMLKEAESDLIGAVDLQMQLVNQFSDQPDRHNELAGTCVNLALLLRQRGDLAGAKQRLLAGRPHHLAALAADPRRQDYRQFYHNHLRLLAEVHASLLEREDVLRLTSVRRDVGWHPASDAYSAACTLCRCCDIVEKHDMLDAEQQQAARQFYADHAMAMLRDAVSKGFRDAKRLRQDPALAPLRDRQDFQALLAELEKEPPQ
ncbi:MAG: tetratricopeptide repeat protein, partial [Gemmatales bacterium]|nr:tetratricopeptide repeat protein [Gemmatales bacterium]MDW8385663.1 tetratricopeptide repeat protein [Gemmatales bacterium]